MTRLEKIELLKRIEAGADLFSELNKDQVIVLMDGKYQICGKEVTKEQADKFTGIVVEIVKVECDGSDFDKA